jgi:hypothetical protein
METPSKEKLKEMIEVQNKTLSGLKTEMNKLEKLRNFSDLKIIYRSTYDCLREDENLVDKLITEKKELVRSLSKKIEKLEQSKKIEAAVSRLFSDQDERKRKELEKYINKTKSLSSLDESKKIDFIVENLKIIKPAYQEYERLEKNYRDRVDELVALQKENQDTKIQTGISSYLLMLAIFVLVLNILFSY